MVTNLGLGYQSRENGKNQSPEQKQRLDDIGFIWDPLAEQWEEAFGILLQYKEAEGNCRVPYGHKLRGLILETGYPIAENTKKACPLNVDKD